MAKKLNPGSPVGDEIAALKESIETLKGLIDSGATTVVQDGQSVSFDQKLARKRLRELQSELATLQGTRSGRPRWFNVNLR